MLGAPAPTPLSSEGPERPARTTVTRGDILPPKPPKSHLAPAGEHHCHRSRQGRSAALGFMLPQRLEQPCGAGGRPHASQRPSPAPIPHGEASLVPRPRCQRPANEFPRAAPAHSNLYTLLHLHPRWELLNSGKAGTELWGSSWAAERGHPRAPLMPCQLLTLACIPPLLHPPRGCGASGYTSGNPQGRCFLSFSPFSTYTIISFRCREPSPARLAMDAR